MTQIRIQKAASLRLDDIYRYTRDRWGEDQADRYITELFEAFDQIQAGGVSSRPIPAEFDVSGYYFQYERHFVYWRPLANDDTGIVTILHERMHHTEWFKDRGS